MELSKGRIGEIALILLRRRVDRDGGVELHPGKIEAFFKKEAPHIEGVTREELVEFIRHEITHAQEKVMTTLQEIATGGTFGFRPTPTTKEEN